MRNTLLPDRETMIRAFSDRDASFDGIFFTAVTTTGIFCRPACPAKKAKLEHLIFFPQAKDALAAGFRPCKLCHPMEPHGTPPDWVREVFASLESEGAGKLTDRQLRTRSIDPDALRRWFKRHHGMTFQAYLRFLRIGSAIGRIQHGEPIIEAAFECGYDSLSGFNEAVRKVFGDSCTRLRGTSLIAVTRIPTPLGPMLTGATDAGICLLEFVDRRMLETQLDRIKRLLKAHVVPGTHPLFNLLAAELRQYFSGSLQVFSLPLDTPGTPFQQRVWAALQTIPYGSTRSYKEQASSIGMPEAVRAVARANGDNRISILIPCHRVIGSDGRLTGYGGGLWRKQFLLNLEQSSFFPGTNSLRDLPSPPAA